MLNLTLEDRRHLIEILELHDAFSSAAELQNVLRTALMSYSQGRRAVANFRYPVAPRQAATSLIDFLLRFGQVDPGIEALGAVIEEVLASMGLGADADFLRDVIDRYSLINRPNPCTHIPNSGTNTEVFISFASPDQAITVQLDNYLSQNGIITFFSPKSILPGANWQQEIENALNRATHLLLMMSSASMPYRREVHLEWSKFEQLNKPIIPFLIQTCKSHYRLATLQHIDARTNFAQALTVLLNRL